MTLCDTETVTINVAGSNDGPFMHTAGVSRTTAEDSETPDLTETGLALFTDVDLDDTHTTGSSLQSAVLSTGDAVSAGLEAVLGAAMTHIPLQHVDHRRYRRGAVELRARQQCDRSSWMLGETLTAIYHVTATDNPAAPQRRRRVTINITGVNEAPPPGGSLTPATVEGNEGDALDFTFTRTGGDLSQSLTINYVVNDGLPAGGATRPSDFSYASGMQTLTFDPFQSTATISVQTLTDGALEGDESFPVLLARDSTTPSIPSTTGRPGSSTMSSVTIHDHRLRRRDWHYGDRHQRFWPCRRSIDRCRPSNRLGAQRQQLRSADLVR